VIGSGITEIRLDFFMELREVRSLILPDSLVVIRERGLPGLQELISVEWGHGLKEIGPNAFWDSRYLRLDNLPDSLEVIGEEAFSWCETSDPIFLGPNVRELGGAWWPSPCEGIFVDSANLWFTNLSNGALFTKDLSTVLFWPPSGYETIQELPPETHIVGRSAFASVRSAPFPEGFLSRIDDVESYAFVGTALRFFDASRIKVIPPYAFTGCSDLETVIFSPELIEVGEFAFNGCDHLQLSWLPENLRLIGGWAFRQCPKMNITELPNVLQVGAAAFEHCAEVKTIDFGVLTSIGGSCFDDSGIVKVWLPDTLVNIASYGFSRTALAYISISGAITGITANSFAEIIGVPEIHIRGPVGTTLCSVMAAVWPTNNGVFVSSWSGVENGDSGRLYRTNRTRSAAHNSGEDTQRIENESAGTNHPAPNPHRIWTKTARMHPVADSQCPFHGKWANVPP
jgi:hypothetical protein